VVVNWISNSQWLQGKSLKVLGVVATPMNTNMPGSLWRALAWVAKVEWSLGRQVSDVPVKEALDRSISDLLRAIDGKA
jgi:hypothetical protein